MRKGVPQTRHRSASGAAAAGARPRLDARRLVRLVEGFPRLHVLVVGDVMLDEYLWGDVERVSPEAPVPVVRVRRESQELGGAGNVVRNVVALGARCSFCGAVGADRAGRRVVDLLKDRGVDPGGLVAVEGRPTTRKTRVEARSQQIVRFDREETEPLPRGAVRRLLAGVEAALPVAQAVVLEDYGKGVLSRSVTRAVIERARARGIPVYVDPKEDLQRYRGAALIKPNWSEAETLSGVRLREPRDLVRALERLYRGSGGARIVVTRGPLGMTVLEGGAALHVPTVAPEVYDRQGCGDTSIAALALALSAGASLLEAVVIANGAAGVVARKVGTATATPEELCGSLPAVAAAARRAA